jgi:AcrR family transcriptional regulator
MTDRMAQILDAACRVIVRDGASALRMADVADEAGVSRTLVHYYFETRADLLAKVFAYTDDRADERAVAGLRTLPTGLRRVERLLGAYLEDEKVFRTNWVLWMETWRAAVFEPELREPVVESNRLWIRQIAEQVEQGQADGSIPKHVDAQAAAHRLVAQLDGLGQQVLIGGVERRRAVELLQGAIALELGVTITHQEAVA